MPAFANIAINDGKTTPVLHTFAPDKFENGTSYFENRAASILEGNEKLSFKVVKPTGPSAAYRLLIKMVRPVVASVNGIDTVVRYSTTDVTLNFPKDGSPADRKDERVLLQNLLANTSVQAAIDNLESFY